MKENSSFPYPVGVWNPASTSPLLLVCEHASNTVPSGYHRLGLSEEDLHKHIAWDVGAFGVAFRLALRLRSCLIFQNYSRLLIDCNRRLDSSGLIVEASEGIAVPGNCQLSEEEKKIRISCIWQPYVDTLKSILYRRGKKQKTFLINLHSFTRYFFGEEREVQFGVLTRADYHGYKGAEKIFQGLSQYPEWLTVYDQPYQIDDDDLAVPMAEEMGIPSVLLEIRNDLINEPVGQEKVSGILAPIFEECGSLAG